MRIPCHGKNSLEAFSKKIPMKVGVHHGSALSPLLYKLAMDESTKSFRKGDP